MVFISLVITLKALYDGATRRKSNKKTNGERYFQAFRIDGEILQLLFVYMFCWFVYSTDQQWDASTWVYTHFHWIKSHTSKKLPTLLTYGCHCQMISFSTIPPLCHFLTSLVLSVSFDPSFLITHLKWNIWQMLYACIVHGNDRS